MDVHTNVHTPGQRRLSIFSKRSDQSCQGRLCRGARHVGRRTLTARELNCWTQWTRTAGTGRPGCALSPIRGGRRLPRSVPTVRRAASHWGASVCLYAAVVCEEWVHVSDRRPTSIARFIIDQRVRRFVRSPVETGAPSGRCCERGFTLCATARSYCSPVCRQNDREARSDQNRPPHPRGGTFRAPEQGLRRPSARATLGPDRVPPGGSTTVRPGRPRRPGMAARIRPVRILFEPRPLFRSDQGATNRAVI